MGLLSVTAPKIKLEIPRLVNWTNQIASNNDM